MKHAIWLTAFALAGLVLMGGATGCSLWHHEEHPTGTHEHPTEHPTAKPEAEHPTEHHEHPGTTHEAEHPQSAAPREAVFARVDAVAFATLAAREHPAEHPTEHPRARRRPEPKPPTMEQVGDAIAGYITEDTRLKGGYFLIYDERDEEVLMLHLDKVHRERLAKTAERTYFACTDLKTPEGKVYDLDFWMKQNDWGQLEVTEIMIHKEAGEARYTWYEEGGVWKRRPVE